MDMSPIRQVWPKPSYKARWKGEEDEADRRRGGPGVGKVPQGSEEQRKMEETVVKSSLVPQEPSWLRDKWSEARYSLPVQGNTGPQSSQLAEPLQICSGSFLACVGFLRMFDHSFPACAFCLFEVEISWHTLIPLFMTGSVHSGLLSWDYCGQMFPDNLPVSSLLDWFLHCPLWTDPGLKSEISVHKLISTLKKSCRLENGSLNLTPKSSNVGENPPLPTPRWSVKLKQYKAMLEKTGHSHYAVFMKS